ncbi:MAG: hypothetical protein ABI042_15530 [Verrucomicrobiota bacterium]
MRTLIVIACLFSLHLLSTADVPRELRVGIAGHAFDHLGGIGDQADAAIASGMTIIYPGCFGQMGAEGLPAPKEIEILRKQFSDYLAGAKKNGIKLALAYVCSTSIVKLETFDKNWSQEFRGQFSTPPAQWLQQDREGKPLPSWYGGNYLPACKNNPDWRTYEKFMVKLQLEVGNDGIFFDNPTVHPQGCYCEHCMKKFARFLEDEGQKIDFPKTNSLAFLRQLAVNQPKDFLRFRSTTARDFMADMRTYARTIKPGALITCNNSLNSPEAFFSQSRSMGYNIFEMSKVEDLVVVEDMANQPRVLANGTVMEYGPVYELLRAISHNKPLVAVTIADGDYHTPPNLMRLAMAEAAAHQASYLSWPTWPEDQRSRMISGVRPEAIFLRENANLLNETTQRADVLLFLPFQNWVETDQCKSLEIARTLSRSNVQFEAVAEENFSKKIQANPRSVLVAESPDAFSAPEKMAVEKFKKRGGNIIFTSEKNWLTELESVAKKSAAILQGPSTLRLVVHDQPKKTIVHLLNLNVQRLSSFEDKVTAASDVRLQVRVPFQRVRSVKAITADSGATQGLVQFTFKREKNEAVLVVTIPRIALSTILVIE